MNQQLRYLLGAIGALFLCLTLTLGCSYHRLDNSPCMSSWLKKGETVRVDNLKNNTDKLGIEDRFRKALENRIVAASPWKLQTATSDANWIIQATIERYKVCPLGLIAYKGFENFDLSSAAKGSPGRLSVSITASVRLLDGVTGEIVVVRPELTFSRQYRVDLNFAGFYNQELRMLDTMADDFAESFLIQLLEGIS